MMVECPAQSTPDEALDKLAETLERAAKTLRERARDGVLALPLFEDPYAK